MNRFSLRILPAIALLALAFSFSSCKQEVSDDVKTKEELLSSNEPTDSILYFLGQIRAYQYWKRTDSDSTLRSDDQREKFLKGVRDGLNMVQEDDPTYNYGLRLGIRVAEQIYQLEDDYDVQLHRKQFFSSLQNGLYTNEPINPLAMQAAYYQVLHGMEANHSKAESERTFRSIMGVAEEYDLKQVRTGLWWREVKPGHGPNIRPGDRITIEIDYTRTDGESLGMPSPEIQIVGRGSMPQVLTDAYCLLRDGSSAIFATSSQLVFGTRGDLIGLRPTNIILIHVTVQRVEHDSNPSTPDFDDPDPKTVEHTDSTLIL